MAFDHRPVPRSAGWVFALAALLLPAPAALSETSSGGSQAEAKETLPIEGWVQDEGERPLGGVTVELLTPRSDWRRAHDLLLGEEPAAVARTATRPDGSFRLQAPGSGAFLVRLMSPQGSTTLYRLPVVDGQGGHLLMLYPRQALTVEVVDPQGRPVSGALVRVAPAPRKPARRQGRSLVVTRRFSGAALATPRVEEASGRTDEDGRSEVAIPLKRELRIQAFLPASGAAGLEGSGLAPATRSIYAPGEDLDPDQELELRRVLQGAPGQESERQRAAGPVELVGRHLRLELGPGEERTVVVRDPSGAPVEGALVSLGDPPLPAGRSGADGSLAVPAPPDRALPVRADGEDGRRASGWISLPPAADTSAQEAGATGESPKPVSLTLEPPPMVEGLVLARMPAAPEVGRDAERQPLVDAEVWAFPWDGRAGGSTARTAPDGSYRLPWPAAAAPHLVTVTATGHLPDHHLEPGVPERDAGPRPRRLPTAVLQPTAAVAGRVVGPRGEAVAGARLTASNPSGPVPVLGRSGPDGRFRLPGLAPAVGLRLAARASGHGPLEEILVPLEAGEERRLVLELPAAVDAVGRVVDSGEEPVVGASVWAARRKVRSAFGGVLSRRPSEADLATTDAGGLFELHGLAPGDYDLQVGDPRFAPTRVPGVVIPEPPAATIARDGGEMGGASLRDPSTVDLGTIVLDAGTWVEGRVVDSQGNPLAGARIGAHDGDRLSRRSGEPPNARSASDGTFRLGPFAPESRLMLQVGLEGFARRLIHGLETPAAEPVEVVLERAARITGRVVDPRGRGVEDAEVETEAPKGPSFRGWMAAARARSGEAGEFEVVGIAPGTLRLKAEAQGYLPTRGPLMELAEGESVEDVVLEVSPGATLTGRVLGPDGRSLQGAVVQRLEARSSGRGAVRAAAASTSDPEGSYRMESIPPGEHSFRASHPGFTDRVRDLRVEPGDNHLDFHLGTGRRVSGRVLGPDGAPAGGTRVFLGQAGMGLPKHDLTGGDGTFELRGVRDGLYHLRVAHRELGSLQLEETVEVRGSDVTGLELRYEAGSTLRGRVTGVNLDHLAAVRVSASGRRGQLRATSPDYRGEFRLEGLSPGPWTVMAQLTSANLFTRQEVELVAGAEAEVELDLGGSLTLSGKVLVDGEPTPGLRLFLGSEATVPRRKISGPAGAFRFPLLDPGSYRLAVRRTDGEVVHEEEVDLDSDLQILIELDEGLDSRRLAGRVVDRRTGEPLEGAEVTARKVPEPEGAGGYGPSTFARTGSQGRFLLSDLSSAVYRLRVSRQGYGQVERSVDLAPGGDPPPLTVELEPSPGLELRVASPPGTGGAQVWVVAVDPNGGVGLRASFPVGEGGRVRLDRLGDGAWTLHVAGPATGVAVVPVVVAPGAPPVPVRLPPRAQLRVAVPPLEEGGGRITLVDAQGHVHHDPSGPTPTPGLRQGRARFDRLAPGIWQVRVRTEDGRSWSRTVQLTAGETARVTLGGEG